MSIFEGHYEEYDPYDDAHRQAWTDEELEDYENSYLHAVEEGFRNYEEGEKYPENGEQE